jgi:hypothetical protein
MDIALIISLYLPLQLFGLVEAIFSARDLLALFVLPENLAKVWFRGSSPTMTGMASLLALGA